MHWISLIGFFTIIYFCQTQPITFTGNGNKGGMSQIGSSGNSHSWFESRNNVGSFVQTSTNIVPSVQVVKGEHNTLKAIANNGNNDQCYMILSLILAALMAIIHF